MFWTLPLRRISQNSSPRKSTVGPKLSRKLSHHGMAVSSGSALTTTLLRARSCASALVSAKAGISVLNRVVDVPAEYDRGRLKTPWIAVPLEVISATFPVSTCRTKYGLYGTRSRDAVL